MRRFVDVFGLTCVLCSGVAALGHELLWTRRLVDLLGGASEANTRVLSLFFLGLSVGAVLAHVALPRLRRPWRAAGWAELMVAVLALPAFFLSHGRDWLWAELAIGAGGGGWLKLLISIAVIVPPSVAMGVTLPCFVTAVTGPDRRLTQWGMAVYIINTLGGLLGLLGVALIALPAWGASTSMLLMIGINVSLAVGCWVLDQSVVAGIGAAADPTSRAVAGNGAIEVVQMQPESVAWYGPGGLWLWIAFFSGFGLLSLEIVGLQLLMLVAPLSFHAPTAILAVVILMLTVGACIAPWLAGSGGSAAGWSGSTVWLGRSLAAGGAALLATAPWFFSLVTWLSVDSASSLAGFMARVMGLAVLTFGPALLCAGLLFPLTCLSYWRQQGDVGGRSWAWLLAANGIGGLLGAELAYRVLLPNFGVNTSIALIGLGYLTSGMLVAQMLRGWELESSGGWIVALCVGGAFTWGWVAKLPEVNPYVQFSVLHRESGPEGSLAVVERPDFGRAILVSNQYLLGSTGALPDQRRQGHLPLLLHRQPQRVGFIGLATGITPSAALQHAAVEEVVAVEISSAVVRLAEQYFSQENLGIVGHARARVIVEDGRTFTAAQVEQFDVLVGDLYLPWATGASRLYSVEHFAACHRALRPGGLFCQWLPMHQLTEAQLARIVASFRQAFPEVHGLINSFSAQAPALGLVGWREGEWDWDVIAARCDELREVAGIPQPSLRYKEGLAMHYLGRLSDEPIGVAPITLDNLWLELDAGRRQVTKRWATDREPYLFQDAWRAWMMDSPVGAARFERSDEWAVWREGATDLLAWEGAGMRQDPAAENKLLGWRARVPTEWRQEIQVWDRQWPGPNPFQHTSAR